MAPRHITLSMIFCWNSFVTVPDGIAQVSATWRPPPLSVYQALCLHLLCLSLSTQTGHELLAAGLEWL